MPLSDTEIRAALNSGEIRISPIERDTIQPASVDVRLSASALVFDSSPEPLDLTSESDLSPRYRPLDLSTPYVIPPGGFVLGSCMETIDFGPYCGLVLNRSSIARAGLNCVLSGYANPGYSGTLPLALTNSSGVPLKIVAGRRLAQVLFLRAGEVAMGYKVRGGKYYGEKGATPSKHHLDPDVREALRALGLTGSRLERVGEVLDRRLDEAAARAVKNINPEE